MSAGAASFSTARQFSARNAAWPVLALAALALLLLFRQEAGAAVRVWSSSSAFGHCFLVLPIALWLGWERRGAIVGQMPRPLPWVALAGLPIAAGWLAAGRIGVMEGRQLIAMTALQLLVIAVLGWRFWRILSVPLLYLFFLVPFGAFLVPALQAFTTRFIDVGLDVLGVPHAVDAFVIDIPAGTFRVAEACAGLRFLIAAIAFGVLYACVMYRSPWRRVAFIAASVVVPVVANGLRALGIVVLGDALGSTEAAAVDHLLYGWVFFSLVIALLILAGLPFREDPELVRAVHPRRADHIHDETPKTSRMVAASTALILLVACGPAAGAWLERRAELESARLSSDRATSLLAAFTPVEGCVDVPAQPLPAAAAHRAFDCEGIVLEARAMVFSLHAGAAEIVAAEHAASFDQLAEDARTGALRLERGEPHVWMLTKTSEPGRVVATVHWTGTRPALGGLAFRLGQAWSSIVGSEHSAVLLSVSAEPGAEPDGEGRAERAIRSLLEGQRRLTGAVARLGSS